MIEFRYVIDNTFLTTNTIIMANGNWAVMQYREFIINEFIVKKGEPAPKSETWSEWKDIKVSNG